MKKGLTLLALTMFMFGITACESDTASAEALYEAECTTCDDIDMGDSECTTCDDIDMGDSECTTCDDIDMDDN